jgi:hypothetical protein
MMPNPSGSNNNTPPGDEQKMTKSVGIGNNILIQDIILLRYTCSDGIS